MSENRLRFITYTLGLVSLLLIYITFQLTEIIKQTRYSYLEQNSGSTFKIDNRTGVGCLVAAGREYIDFGRTITTDFSECLVDNDPSD